jgi:hypothetical protein
MKKLESFWGSNEQGKKAVGIRAEGRYLLLSANKPTGNCQLQISSTTGRIMTPLPIFLIL